MSYKGRLQEMLSEIESSSEICFSSEISHLAAQCYLNNDQNFRLLTDASIFLRNYEMFRSDVFLQAFVQILEEIVAQE